MITVIHPGMFTTVQDLGREGYAHLGVSPAGAADALTFRIGNLLLGNPESTPALEFTLAGGRYRAEAETFVVVAADTSVERDRSAAAPWRALRLKPGQELSIGPLRAGLRGYLCVAGGICVPPWLGSASTHTPSALGGFHGRALQKEDRLQIAQPNLVPGRRALQPALRKLLQPRFTIQLTPGPHYAWLRSATSTPTKQWLEECDWKVLPASNRMGLRLAPVDGAVPFLPSERFGSILSIGVPCGALQVTPSQELLLLGVDSQTTGGYPVAASVTSADFPYAGQLRPGDSVRFKLVNVSAARQQLLHQESLLSTLRDLPA